MMQAHGERFAVNGPVILFICKVRMERIPQGDSTSNTAKMLLASYSQPRIPWYPGGESAFQISRNIGGFLSAEPSFSRIDGKH